MNNKKSSKYRLILSLTDQDVAFERLFREMSAIEHEFADAESINHAKRKHFLDQASTLTARLELFKNTAIALESH